MKQTSIRPNQALLKRLAAPLLGALLFASSASLNAQDAAQIRQQYPEVADLFNAFDVTQAKAFEERAAINADPATQQARNELAMSMNMRANMTMSEMMSAGMMTHDGPMDMGMGNGPHHDLEVAARMRLLELMRGKHSNEDAETAFENSSAIGRHTAEVFKHGRNFEEALFTIYIDDDIQDKRAAVAVAIENYQIGRAHV